MGIWLLLPPLLFYMLRPHIAALLTLLSSMMFLPERIGFNVPVLPPMGKDELASVACMLCCVAFAPGRLLQARPFRGPDLLVVVMCIGTVLSTITNQDALRYGPIVVPGTELTAAVAAVLTDLMTWGFPFLIGRAYFTRSKDLRDLFVVLVFAGLLYSVLILIELRLSPQLHRWVYGFHQHSFAQTLRDGGSYRPMVFMRHGLNLAMFTVIYMTSAWILTQTRYRLPVIPMVPKIAIAGYLTTILLLIQSTAATLYGLLIVPLVYFATARIQVAVAVSIAVVALVYPAIRVSQLLPVEEIVQTAEEQFGAERAQSLGGRLRTEEELTAFIQARPLFGWAHTGRTQIFDDVTGESLTTFDGIWLIQFLCRGIVGFVCLFGLLLVPIFQAFWKLGGIRSKQDRAMISGLCLMVAIHVFDLIPNSTTEAYLTVLSGALSGSVTGILREQSSRDRAVRDGRVHSGSPAVEGGSGPGRTSGRNEPRPTLGRDLLGSGGVRRRNRSRRDES